MEAAQQKIELRWQTQTDTWRCAVMRVTRRFQEADPDAAGQQRHSGANLQPVAETRRGQVQQQTLTEQSGGHTHCGITGDAAAVQPGERLTWRNARRAAGVVNRETAAHQCTVRARGPACEEQRRRGQCTASQR